MAKVQIMAFYRFFPVNPGDLERFSQDLETLGRDMGLRGLLIFAHEGINGTVCTSEHSQVPHSHLLKFLERASVILGTEADLTRSVQNFSEAERWPFQTFKVKLRDEIVTLGKPEVQPLAREQKSHLSPEEWDHALSEPGTVVLDTRNWYETQIGKFKGAIDPKIEEFSQWGDFLKNSQLPKEQKILIYCTGGIRCEKAIVEMKHQGFDNVFQLDGGILRYLKEKPDQQFEGECFVFDTRVAVDQNLQPSQTYKMCPHCGQPAQEVITCRRCDSTAVVCASCRNLSEGDTCSKNCAHHSRLAPGVKGRPQAPRRSVALTSST